MFAKNGTIAQKLKSERIRELLQQANFTPEGVLREAIIAEVQALMAEVPAKVKGVRLDIAIDALGSQQLLIDVTGRHSTVPGTAKKTFQFAASLLVAPTTGTLNTAPSPAMEKAENDKKSTYAPLFNQLNLQHML